MKTPKGQIERTGRVMFGDASLSIWEDPEVSVWGEWGKRFRKDVFLRMIQQLRRLGWTVGPWVDAAQYKSIAKQHRSCSKGELSGELGLHGRTIEFKMWQDVANVENRNGGKYDFDKEDRAPYLLRLEMERTRRKIRDYLCNVFKGYVFKESRRGRGSRVGVSGVTAMEYIEGCYEESWHFKGDVSTYEISDYNNKSRDNSTVNHKQRVWFADRKGRICTGIAYYNINNMWWVVTGKYDVRTIASFDLFTKCPNVPRLKRNMNLKESRLKSLIQKAAEKMEFERSATLRDILYPSGLPEDESCQANILA